MSVQRGNVYETRTGYGIRWREGDQRRFQSGFRTKTDARAWFRDKILPRLDRVGPSAEITFDDFCDQYHDRWGADVARRTVETLREWLKPARQQFKAGGSSSQLEGATDDTSCRWRSTLLRRTISGSRRPRALRQVLAAAVRWGYITRNVAEGLRHEPRAAEPRRSPRSTREQIDALAVELGPEYGPMVVFAAETGLRTNEWTALERRG